MTAICRLPDDVEGLRHAPFHSSATDYAESLLASEAVNSTSRRPAVIGKLVPPARNGSGRQTSNRAFSIEDILIAARWAQESRSRGYTVIVTPDYAHADEVIEVYLRAVQRPAFIVYPTTISVVVVDYIGLTMSFTTLADALFAIAPLPKARMRAVLKDAPPEWLPKYATSSRPILDLVFGRARTILSHLMATGSVRPRRFRRTA